ncbi:MAG: DNA translocase FtsK [Bacteroidales bacterium]|nr:DNA translocase FtsK [Bacteroidales bacterium]
MTKYNNYSPEIPYDGEPLPPVDKPQREEPVAATVDKPVTRPAAKKKKKKVVAARPVKSVRNEMRSFKESFSGFVDWISGPNARLLLGIFLTCLGVYMGVAFISYFADCMKDQALINNTPIGLAPPVSNSAGEGGARLAEFLINEGFGLGAFVIVFWLVAMALKHLVGKPRFKSVDFTIKCFVALITVSLIVGLLTIKVDTPVNWGGYHGRYVNEFIVHFFGWTGAVVLCIFMLAVFVVICLRDFVNWIIRLKKKAAQKRHVIMEARRRKEEKERAREEMLRQEELELAKVGEGVSPEAAQPEPEIDDTQVTFSPDDVDSGYYTLPDDENFDSDPEGLRDRTRRTPHAAYMPREAASSPLAPSSSPAPSMESGVVAGVTTDALSSHPAPSPSPSPSAVAASSDGSSHGIEAEQTGEPAASDDGDVLSDPMVVNVNQIDKAEPALFEKADGLPGSTPYQFPPVELLRPGVERISVDATEQLENKERIRKTLLDFGIPIVSIEATVGPTVTLYEIVPDKGVKTAKIRGLVDDIALSLAAVGVRIIAPIPGKGTVGIEVANKEPQTVSMRTVIQSRKYQESRYKLPIALGSTISNDVYIADLAKMPHLLVAGATGQGKSVGLNAIIASLLYRKSPDELKFVMIDPKMVEFSLYAKIEKHYLAKLPGDDDPIITDMTRVVATLSSLCVEMDDRYQLLKSAHVRNIEEYNSKMIDRKLDPAEGHRYLPYIVLIVDEFSDLIMTSGKEVEIPIARLAQKARAVGMHVIVATQRPSTNVITGIIKANFPARMAFKVSSGVDSKTILDTSGAQQLIGRGDMLILDSSEMVRVQCAFIDTPEVEEICDYIASQPGGGGAYILPEPIVGGGDDDGEGGGGPSFGDRDPLFDEIARTIVSSNTASTSSLQRRYSIGYNRAGKIMDQMEAAGIVGPSHGGKPRAVLVDAVTLESILGS